VPHPCQVGGASEPSRGDWRSDLAGERERNVSQHSRRAPDRRLELHVQGRRIGIPGAGLLSPIGTSKAIRSSSPYIECTGLGAGVEAADCRWGRVTSGRPKMHAGRLGQGRRYGRPAAPCCVYLWLKVVT
jgi:hypothetical protein